MGYLMMTITSGMQDVLKRFAKVGGEMVFFGQSKNVLEKYLPEVQIVVFVEIIEEKKGSYIVAAVSAK
jgi:hypothetical protein